MQTVLGWIWKISIQKKRPAFCAMSVQKDKMYVSSVLLVSGGLEYYNDIFSLTLSLPMAPIGDLLSHANVADRRLGYTILKPYNEHVIYDIEREITTSKRPDYVKRKKTRKCPFFLNFINLNDILT